MLYANPFAYVIGILAKEGYNHVLCKVELKCRYQCFAVIDGDIFVISMQYMRNYYAMTCFLASLIWRNSFIGVLVQLNISF